METKICTGPAHPQPTALPVDRQHWYFRKSGPKAGEPVSRCVLCINWRRLNDPGMSGTVPCDKIRPFARELVDRYGSYNEAMRQTTISDVTLRSIMNKDYCTVQKRTALRVLQALEQKRREDRRDRKISSKFLEARRKQANIEERLQRSVGY